MGRINDLEIITFDDHGWPDHKIHWNITVEQALEILGQYLEQHDTLEIGWTKIHGLRPKRE